MTGVLAFISFLFLLRQRRGPVAQAKVSRPAPERLTEGLLSTP